MDKWWKAPILQGPENEYGELDFYASPLPQNRHEWIKGECRCDSCGKYRHLSTRDTSYFYCIDGYDYLSYTECWVCLLATKIYRMKKPFKNAKFLWKQRREVRLLWKSLKKKGASNKHCINTLWGLLTQKGV